MDEERELQEALDLNSNIKPLSSTLCKEIADLEALLGAARESDSEVDAGILDLSIGSQESTGLASIQLELATLSVSQDVSATQMDSQHPPQKKQRGSLTAGRKHLDGVRAVQGGVSSPGTGMESSAHTRASNAMSDSDEDMAVPGGDGDPC